MNTASGLAGRGQALIGLTSSGSERGFAPVTGSPSHRQVCGTAAAHCRPVEHAHTVGDSWDY